MAPSRNIERTDPFYFVAVSRCEAGEHLGRSGGTTCSLTKLERQGEGAMVAPISIGARKGGAKVARRWSSSHKSRPWWRWCGESGLIWVVGMGLSDEGLCGRNLGANGAGGQLEQMRDEERY